MDYRLTLEDIADIIGDSLSGVTEWKLNSMRLEHNVGKPSKIIVELKEKR